jgi:hypothetical protein
VDAPKRLANRTRPEFSLVKGSDLPLSGPALVHLLRAMMDKGAPVRFRAKGFSMSPFIKNKDVVTISPLQDNRPTGLFARKAVFMSRKEITDLKRLSASPGKISLAL